MRVFAKGGPSRSEHPRAVGGAAARSPPATHTDAPATTAGASSCTVGLMNRPALLVAWLLLLAPLARADVVHLTTGGKVSGTVVRDDDRGVVIKTPDGTVTFPRRMVARVERQSRGETLLALARERFKAGAYAEAERLYREAAEDPDADLAAKARRELKSMLAAREKAKGMRRPPRTPLPLPGGVTGTAIEGESLQEQLDRARSAIDAGDGLHSSRLLEPLATGNPEQRVLRYLYGRALELAGRDDEAQREFLAALGREGADGRPVGWLSDLARRRQAGLELRSRTPGVGGRGWRRLEPSPTFAVYAPAARTDPWLASEPELALAAVLEELSIPRRDLFLAGRVQVLVYADAAALAADRGGERPGLPPGAGHEAALPAPDGALWLLVATAEQEAYGAALRHQLAHLALREGIAEAPPWLREGAACALFGALAGGTPAPRLPDDLRAFLSAEEAPAAGEAGARFCSQAQAVYEALERRLGRKGALRFGRTVGRKGLDEALRASDLSLESLAASGD